MIGSRQLRIGTRTLEVPDPTSGRGSTEEPLKGEGGRPGQRSLRESTVSDAAAVPGRTGTHKSRFIDEQIVAIPQEAERTGKTGEVTTGPD